MQQQRPPRLSADLELRIEGGATRLTPRQGLRLAENLVRKSMRRAMAEAVETEPPTRSTPSTRSTRSRT